MASLGFKVVHNFHMMINTILSLSFFFQENIELMSDELKSPKYSAYFVCK